MSEVPISSIEGLITRIRSDVGEWSPNHAPWFRGEPIRSTQLLPRLYRQLPYPNENQLLQTFRMMAPSFASEPTPPREATDQWLCLAQHVGLPTRLLDWTENALLALHFALPEDEPVVWMLNPIELNALSVSESQRSDEFPLTWVCPDLPRINIGFENVRGAWEQDQAGVDLPVAILPPYVHPRMAAQRSRFTVHGRRKESLYDLLPPKILKRYIVDPARKPRFQQDLRMLGIQEATAFPDLDGLAKELRGRYA